MSILTLTMSVVLIMAMLLPSSATSNFARQSWHEQIPAFLSPLPETSLQESGDKISWLGSAIQQAKAQSHGSGHGLGEDPLALSRLDSAPQTGAKSSLDRKVRTKDLSALRAIYNVTFDQRDQPDVHVSMASEDTILLKVQQNELIDDARTVEDFVQEPFDIELNRNNVRVLLDNGRSLKPKAVYRKSKVADGLRQANRFVIDHYYHIKLPQKLKENNQYVIKFPAGNLADIRFKPANSISLAIHHARAYDINNPVKRAKVSSWMSRSGGGINYQVGTPFRIIDEDTGRTVYRGSLTRNSSADSSTGTAVFDIDFSELSRTGTYRIKVDGIGQSLPFEIREGVWQNMLDLSLEGLYVHRAFVEMAPPYIDFRRPANREIVFYPSSFSEADFDFFDAGNEFAVLPDSVDRRRPRKITGGWFDAGDFDTNTEHFAVVESLVDLFNSSPGYFESFRINIPESGNDIPDILDEALWGMELYKNLQDSDGAVAGGYEFGGTPNAAYGSWEEPEGYLYAPDFWTSHRFAAAAAKLSTALEPYDRPQANDLRRRAIKAMQWAEREFAKLESVDFKKSHQAIFARQAAAAELYRLTEDEQYHEIFQEYRNQRKRYGYEALFTYAQLDPTVYTAVDPTWQTDLKNELISLGDELVDYGKQNGFDTLNNPELNQNWGFNTVITTSHGHYIAMAHQLTGDDKYLTALAASMPFGMGMNPDNLAFTTGTVESRLAYDEPDDVLHSDGIILDHMPDGITLYGFYAQPWFAWNVMNEATQNVLFNTESKQLEVPLIEAFLDYHNMVPMTEYTIHQTIEDQIFAFGYLAAHSNVLYRINVGGPRVPSAQGLPDWSPDLANTTSPYRKGGGTRVSTVREQPQLLVERLPVSVAPAASIFQSERYATGQDENMHWVLPVKENSRVEVRLYFAELFNRIRQPGERVFDVAVEGKVPSNLADIDPFAIAGQKTGLMRSYTVRVKDGQLDVELLRKQQNPTLAGIEVLSADTSYPSRVLYRINVGGDTVPAADGSFSWSPDTDRRPSLYCNGNSTRTTTVETAINLDPSSLPASVLPAETIFQSERFDVDSAPPMQWSFPIKTQKSVEVRLYFAELYDQIKKDGERIFDVAVEGRVPPVFDDIDPFAIAGPNTGLMLSYTTKVQDGELNLEFLNQVQNPTLAGIEIVKKD